MAEQQPCEHGKSRPAVCAVCNPEGQFREYERKALIRNLNFDLTLDEFIEVVNEQCEVCGAYPAGSVDRIDNRIGYKSSNVRALCGECNMRRGPIGATSFDLWIQRVTDYQNYKRQQQKFAAEAAWRRKHGRNPESSTIGHSPAGPAEG